MRGDRRAAPPDRGDRLVAQLEHARSATVRAAVTYRRHAQAARVASLAASNSATGPARPRSGRGRRRRAGHRRRPCGPRSASRARAASRRRRGRRARRARRARRVGTRAAAARTPSRASARRRAAPNERERADPLEYRPDALRGLRLGQPCERRDRRLVGFTSVRSTKPGRPPIVPPGTSCPNAASRARRRADRRAGRGTGGFRRARRVRRYCRTSTPPRWPA